MGETCPVPTAPHQCAWLLVKHVRVAQMRSWVRWGTRAALGGADLLCIGSVQPPEVSAELWHAWLRDRCAAPWQSTEP